MLGLGSLGFSGVGFEGFFGPSTLLNEPLDREQKLGALLDAWLYGLASSLGVAKV